MDPFWCRDKIVAGFRILIIGHLDIWRIPPDGSLPREIHQIFNVDAESDAQLVNFVDERIVDVVSSGWMRVYRDPSKRQIGKLEPWISVPLHMITHLSYQVQPLTGEVPIFSSAEGKAVLPSGKDVVIQ